MSRPLSVGASSGPLGGRPSPKLDDPRWRVRWGELAQAVGVFGLVTAVLFHRVLLFGETFSSTIDLYNQHHPITVAAFRTLLGGVPDVARGRMAPEVSVAGRRDTVDRRHVSEPLRSRWDLVAVIPGHMWVHVQ